MPVYKKIKNGDVELFVWQIKETKEELLQLLEPCHELAFHGYSDEERGHLSHNSHFLSTRILLFIEAGLKFPVIKNKYGKPEAKDRLLSITHSHDFAGVILSSTAHVAIDLEKIDPRILKVAHKFMHEEEKFFKHEDEVIYTTLIWSAKETLYKLYSEREVLFKEELRIHAFEFSGKGSFTGDILKSLPRRNIQIHYEVFENYVLTCVF
jgi:4'-phosphopantetheinyl transferase